MPQSDHWTYFAYGSNLLTARLQARTPSAQPLRTAILEGHDLRFHKIGDDDSGKCDAYFTGGHDHRVWGVVYRMAKHEKPVLDAIEGVGQGYALKTVTLVAGNERIQAITYVVEEAYIDHAMVPFDWYHAFVLSGAQEHGLPLAYRERIAEVVTQRDPRDDRRKANQAILKQTGLQTKWGS